MSGSGFRRPSIARIRQRLAVLDDRLRRRPLFDDEFGELQTLLSRLPPGRGDDHLLPGGGL